MYCRKPFIRDPSGRVFRSVNQEDWIDGVPFPCGQCLPCRINKRRQWTSRLVLESFSHDATSFFTLTYNDENLPRSESGLPTLDPRGLQLFLKRLRKAVKVHFRFYACGEYGSKTHRPHYHIVFFGLPNDCYPMVSRCWSCKTSNTVSHVYACTGKHTADPVFTFGSSVGNIYYGYDCSLEAMQYVAGYVTKKISQIRSSPDDPYSRHFYPDGRVREFSRMSRNPGIGIPALLSISKQLRDKAKLDGQFPSQFFIGKRSFPFDRTTRAYLRYLFPEYFTSDFVLDAMREFHDLSHDLDSITRVSDSDFSSFGLLTGFRMLSDEAKVNSMINRLKIKGVFDREA